MSYFKEAINKQAKTLAEIEDAWGLSPKEIVKKKWINIDVVLAEFDKYNHAQEEKCNKRLEEVRQIYKTAYQGAIAENKQKLQQLIKELTEFYGFENEVVIRLKKFEQEIQK